MKGFNTGDGYMGMVDGEYILFASEADYYDYVKKSVNHFSGNTIRIEVEYKPAPITMLYYMILQGRE